ncbi:MAG: Gmad2 immunoglobulin-like domain-containing protein [Patescibacteria group bacterium]|nr:Gmad2 immunoglobulin-like domain-containing protein [Patescibacteria group bacterium]
MNKWWWAVLVVILLVALWATGFLDTSQVHDFRSCVEAGNPVMESYPRQCSDGVHTYTEDIGNVLEKADVIVLDNVVPNQTISSPLKLEGRAVGQWYFEASFPVELKDGNGATIVTAVAEAQGDWMTEAFVPFEVTLKFTTPVTSTGTLVLHKDNPSGEVSNDDELVVPVSFGGE